MLQAAISMIDDKTGSQKNPVGTLDRALTLGPCRIADDVQRMFERRCSSARGV